MNSMLNDIFHVVLDRAVYLILLLEDNGDILFSIFNSVKVFGCCFYYFINLRYFYTSMSELHV